LRRPRDQWRSNLHVDIHQHVWPDALTGELRRRSQPPRLEGWTLLTSGEPPFEVNPADHDVVLRAAQAARDGVGRVVIGPSSPLGIEYLMPEDAVPLLDAYHDGVAELGAPFAGWAAACLTAIDAAGLAKQLDRGFAGLQLPATAVADESGYRWCAPLLDVLAERDLPLFIHPGPAAGANAAGGNTVGGNTAGGNAAGGNATGGNTAGAAWWAALVPYVQQLHAAWFAFRAFGRPAYPRLRVCFAALAGLGPLHGERLAARGGVGPLARGVVDPRVFVETSSYGSRAVDSVLRVLGVDMLVFGSDRPYAQPHPDFGLGGAARHAIRAANPARLLHGDWQPSHAGSDRPADRSDDNDFLRAPRPGSRPARTG
jgi:6-methylsalicylate decarboxylase